MKRSVPKQILMFNIGCLFASLILLLLALLVSGTQMDECKYSEFVNMLDNLPEAKTVAMDAYYMRNYDHRFMLFLAFVPVLSAGCNILFLIRMRTNVSARTL